MELWMLPPLFYNQFPCSLVINGLRLKKIHPGCQTFDIYFWNSGKHPPALISENHAVARIPPATPRCDSDTFVGPRPINNYPYSFKSSQPPTLPRNRQGREQPTENVEYGEKYGFWANNGVSMTFEKQSLHHQFSTVNPFRSLCLDHIHPGLQLLNFDGCVWWVICFGVHQPAWKVKDFYLQKPSVYGRHLNGKTPGCRIGKQP